MLRSGRLADVMPRGWHCTSDESCVPYSRMLQCWQVYFWKIISDCSSSTKSRLSRLMHVCRITQDMSGCSRRVCCSRLALLAGRGCSLIKRLGKKTAASSFLANLTRVNETSHLLLTTRTTTGTNILSNLTRYDSTNGCIVARNEMSTKRN